MKYNQSYGQTNENRPKPVEKQYFDLEPTYFICCLIAPCLEDNFKMQIYEKFHE